MGYDSNIYVKENYCKLQMLIVEMKSGELIDLVGRFMTYAGFQRRKAEEYVSAAISSGWVLVKADGHRIGTNEAMNCLKHKKNAFFESNLGSNSNRKDITELKINSKIMPEEKDGFNLDSPTPFMDLVKRKKLEELKQKLRR